MTDLEGRASAKVTTGLTAIVDGSKGIIKLIMVTPDMSEVKVDTNSLGISLLLLQVILKVEVLN